MSTPVQRSLTPPPATPNQNFPALPKNQTPPEKISFIDEKGKSTDIGGLVRALLGLSTLIPIAAYSALTDRVTKAIWSSGQVGVLAKNLANPTFQRNFGSIAQALAGDKSISDESLTKICRVLIPAFAKVKSNLTDNEMRQFLEKLVDLHREGTFGDVEILSALDEVNANRTRCTVNSTLYLHHFKSGTTQARGTVETFSQGSKYVYPEATTARGMLIGTNNQHLGIPTSGTLFSNTKAEDGSYAKVDLTSVRPIAAGEPVGISASGTCRFSDGSILQGMGEGFTTRETNEK
jgi:hypothetical protein